MNLPDPTHAPALLILRGEELPVPAPITLGDALAQVEVHPETVLAVREGVLVHTNDWLQPGDRVRLVGVISGG